MSPQPAQCLSRRHWCACPACRGTERAAAAALQLRAYLRAVMAARRRAAKR